jgi:hypothetical protein
MGGPVRGPTAHSGRGGGRTVAIVLGALALLIAAVGLVGGGALVAVDATQRDSDGYYGSGPTTLATPTHGFVSKGLDIGSDGPSWLFHQARLGTIRVTATGTAATPIFVGVAHKTDVDSYIARVAHDEVTDFEVDPLSITSTRRTGSETPAPPTGQPFWARSESGSGRQTMTWPVERGDWSVVIMNADGSSGVSSGVSVGAKLGLILWLGVGMVAVGAIFAAAGGAAILLARRPPNRPTGSDGAAAASA